MAFFRRLQAVRAVDAKIGTRDPLYLYQNSRSYHGEISNVLCSHRGYSAFPWISTTRFYSTQIAVDSSIPEKPTATHYDDLINAAAHKKDLDTIHSLLNKRARDKVSNTSNTFKFITNTENSLSTLKPLTQTLARLDNGFARTSTFNALIARLCKLDRIIESMRIVKIMATGKFGLTNGTFYPILNSLSKKKKMEEVWGVMEVMEKEGVSPDITAFNYLLTAYCYIRDITGTIRVLERMEKAGLSADERTYDALVGREKSRGLWRF